MEELLIANKAMKLQRLLGSQLYTNAYSFLQEVVQNSQDVYNKHQITDELILLKLEKCSDVDSDIKIRFSIRDFGPGIESRENIIKYLCTLLESSKEDSEVETGEFGLGKISVSAYTKQWNYNIYHNKIHYLLNLEEKEEGGVFFKLSEGVSTFEKNGVEFFIDIETYEVGELIDNIKDRLMFFKNVKIYADTYVLNSINTTYLRKNFNYFKLKLDELNSFNKLYSNDYFFETNNKSKSVVINNYNYEFNNPFSLPIALKIDAKKVKINPNRETFVKDASFQEEYNCKLEQTAEFIYNDHISRTPKKNNTDIKEMFSYLDTNYTKVEFNKNRHYNYREFLKLHNYHDFNEQTYKGISAELFTKLTDSMFTKLNSYYSIVRSSGGFNRHAKCFNKEKLKPYFIVKNKLSSAKTEKIQQSHYKYSILRKNIEFNLQDLFLSSFDNVLYLNNAQYKYKIDKILSIGKVIYDDFKTAYFQDYDSIVGDKKIKNKVVDDKFNARNIYIEYGSAQSINVRSEYNSSTVYFPNSLKSIAIAVKYINSGQTIHLLSNENYSNISKMSNFQAGTDSKTYLSPDYIDALTKISLLETVNEIQNYKASNLQLFMSEESYNLYLNLHQFKFDYSNVCILSTNDGKVFIEGLCKYFKDANLLNLELENKILELNNQLKKLEIVKYLTHEIPMELIEQLKTNFNL